MWKKTAGIISFVTSFILFMVYFATIENSKSSRSEYEETIRIKQRAIDRYNDYIEECKDARDEVYEYQWDYGSDYLTDALIDKYGEMISDARSDANNARLTIISMQEAISKLKARDIVLIVLGIVSATAGVVFIIIYKRKDNSAEDLSEDAWRYKHGNTHLSKLVSDEGGYNGTNVSVPIDGWKCKKCGRVNYMYVGTCACGNTKLEND